MEMTCGGLPWETFQNTLRTTIDAMEEFVINPKKYKAEYIKNLINVSTAGEGKENTIGFLSEK